MTARKRPICEGDVNSPRITPTLLKPFTRALFGRALATALLFGYGQACTSWRTRPLTPETFPLSNPPPVVRVTLVNGSRFELESPQIVQDSLRGVDARSQRPWTVARSDLQRLETRHFDSVKTVGLVLGLGAATAGAVIISILSRIEN